MAVLAADVQLSHYGEPTKIPVPADAADIYYAGAIVWGKAAGYATVAPSAGDRVLGICTHKQTVAAQGDLVEIWADGLFQFPTIASITAADVGDSAVFDVSAAITDNPADIISGGDLTVGANDVWFGQIKGFVDGKAIIALGKCAIYDATEKWKY
jgi:hypothetical protein